MKENYIAGKWRKSDSVIEVRHPYDDELYAEVPAATPDDALTALDAAEKAARYCRQLGPYQRYLRMLNAAELLSKNKMILPG